MKKVFITCLIIISLIISVIPVSATEVAETVMLGDLDNDEVVSLEDAIIALKCAAGMTPLTEDILFYGDIDDDCSITTADAKRILQSAASIKPPVMIKFSEWEIVREPTCTRIGEAKSYGIGNSRIRKKEIPTIPHTVVEATCTESSYCSNCFKTLSAPLGHTTNCGTCSRCNVYIDTNSYIHIDTTQTAFGVAEETLRTSFGAPDEILLDNCKELPIKYYVYCKDYTRLTIFTISHEYGLIGVYSTNPTFEVITDQTISFDNVTGVYKVGGVYFEDYVDEIGNGSVYAFHATTYRDSTRLYEASNFKSASKLIYHITNAYRAINKLPTLTYSTEVASVALSHSADMANNNYFSHVNLNSEKVSSRLRKANISFDMCGENIAAGYTQSSYDFANDWYNSEGHRANILSKGFLVMGVGIAYNTNSTYRLYATQNFIHPYVI